MRRKLLHAALRLSTALCKARSPPGRRGKAASTPIITRNNAESRDSQAKQTFNWSVEHANTPD